MPADNRDIQRTENILSHQLDDVPVVIDEEGGVHDASDGSRGLAIRDDKGDYGSAA